MLNQQITATSLVSEVFSPLEMAADNDETVPKMRKGEFAGGRFMEQKQVYLYDVCQEGTKNGVQEGRVGCVPDALQMAKTSVSFAWPRK